MVTSIKEEVVFTPNFISRVQDGTVPDCAKIFKIEEDEVERVSFLGLKINGHIPTRNFCVDTIGVGDQLLVLKVFHYHVDLCIQHNC